MKRALLALTVAFLYVAFLCQTGHAQTSAPRNQTGYVVSTSASSSQDLHADARGNGPQTDRPVFSYGPFTAHIPPVHFDMLAVVAYDGSVATSVVRGFSSKALCTAAANELTQSQDNPRVRSAFCIAVK